MILFLEYPKCSTCKKAKKQLDESGVKYTHRNIAEENPSAEELKDWIKKSGADIKKFFNTSGMKYRELSLKDRLPSMTYEEKINLLSTDGMLVKRPILVGDDFVLVGYNEKVWKERLEI